jgi:hypothetical protein
MYDAVYTELERGLVQRIQLLRGGHTLCFGEVIECWRSDQDFVDEFCQLLSESHFTAFRWETPPVTDATLTREFQFVLVKDASLEGREPESDVFAEQLSGCEQARPVASFENLGGDALMVVPAALGHHSAYTDLASFSRAAPLVQQRALWREVGEAMQASVGESPLWLNTAGDGVAWLHIRLDSRPKYYAYAPYREQA